MDTLYGTVNLSEKGPTLKGKNNGEQICFFKSRPLFRRLLVCMNGHRVDIFPKQESKQEVSNLSVL